MEKESKPKFKPRIKYKLKEETPQIHNKAKEEEEKKTHQQKKTPEKHDNNNVKYADKEAKRLLTDKIYHNNCPQSELENIIQVLDNQDQRKLKKYFKACLPNASKIILKYQITKPILFYECVSNQALKLFHIRDVIYSNQQFRKQFNFLEKIYDQLYPGQRITREYFPIAIFGAEFAKNKRLKLKTQKILDGKFNLCHKDYLFYYCTKGYNVNFVIFDKQLNTVEFGSSMVKENKQKYQKEYRIYQRFLQNVIKQKNVQQELNKQIGQQEVDSDQEEREKRIKQRKQISCQKIYEKILMIAEKDLTEYKDQIEIKSQEVQNLNQNNKIDQASKLADQVMEKNQNVENFEKIRDKILQKIKGQENNYQLLQPCLKRMIIAQKQLLSQLPIIARKRQIFERLNQNNLLILQGQTGSGKSTQLPQMLCQYYDIFENPKALPVLVTQPRKLATRTLAQRVAAQMQEEVHGFVDYQASALSKVNQKSKIIFKMDRLVLDELRQDQTLSKYCCLVIDQAHERTINIDVILGLVKNLLIKRKGFKVIVTSASMDTELFKKYFKSDILKVSGRMYPVEEIFKPYSAQNGVPQKIQKLFNQELLEREKIKKKYRGHILVFCSGLEQIQSLKKRFESFLNPRVFLVKALHGRLNPQQQKQVFQKTQLIKVIFATRIAQTSITIDGIKVVIDPGEDIQQVYNQKTKITSMKLNTICQSSAKQRAGRAGRTNEGFCFRLYSREQLNKMSSNKKPEIQNMALDTLVLRLKSLKIKDILSFPYVSPPQKQGLNVSIQSLKMLGCLDKMQNITNIGQILIKLPLEPFLARSILQAVIYRSFTSKDVTHFSKTQQFEFNNIDLVEQVVGILCLVISASNLFFVREENREKADKLKFQKFSSQKGDFFFFRNIMSNYLKLIRDRKFSQIGKWLSDNFLNRKTMKQAQELFKEIVGTLKKAELYQKGLNDIKTHCKMKIKNCSSVNDVILSCLVTSFAPNLCLYSQNPQIGYTMIAHQDIPVQIYGTSILSIQGIYPKWLVCYDLYQNDRNQTYFKVAQQISFSFIKRHVDPYIIQKYNIKNADQINPFYTVIKEHVPTLIFQAILNDYRRSAFTQMYIFQKLKLVFYEDLNIIEFFYRSSAFKKQQPKLSALSVLYSKIKAFGSKIQHNQQQSPYQMINQYISRYNMHYGKFFRHNYVGPIYIDLKQGFDIIGINFKTSETCCKIMAKNEDADLFEQYCSPFGTVEKFSDKIIFYIIEEDNKEQFRQTRNYVLQYFESCGKKIAFEQTIVDRRKKIPQTKLYLKFWAGETQRNNILLKFNNRNVNVSQHLQWLRNGIMKSMSAGKHLLLSNVRLSLTKKQDGINIYPIRNLQIDQFQVAQQISELNHSHYLGYTFTMPEMIKKFRQPDLDLSAKTDEYWHSQIYKLAEKKNIDLRDSAIRIWGYYSKPTKQPKVGIQKQYRVDLHAEIKSYSVLNLQRFKRQYDGKQVLGTEKMHVTFQYQHTATVTTLKVFQALEDQFKYICSTIKGYSPGVTIDHFKKVNRNLTKVFIIARSKKREQIIKPARQISQLFTPKLVGIEDSKFRFLDKFDAGNDVLEDLENEYDFKIYFAFDRRNKIVKLYCQDRLQKQIKDKLFKSLQKFTYYQDLVSYKGKNLHKVIQVLNKVKQQIRNLRDNNKIFEYEIVYQKRKVRITGDLKSYEYATNQIQKIQNKGKAQCDICCDLMQRPFSLFMCSHSFCWACLSSYVKQTINQVGNDILKCPLQTCQDKISVNDIKALLSEEQFNKICDIKVSRFVQKRVDQYHGCYSPNCQNIFLTKQSQLTKGFDCTLCGKWYCTKCKQPHRGITCQAWKANLDDSQLEKLGIRKCPKCGQGIQKNQGCQHMQCRKCHTHICWLCMQNFKSSQQCYGHLHKIHGTFV